MSEVEAGPWLVLGGTIALLLGADLLVHRKGRATSRKSAAVWSVIWIVTGLGFSMYVLSVLGGGAAQEYLAAYLIEKSLSLDNLFVFLVVFQTLGIPAENQHTVLLWGVLSALVFRALFVFLGVAALERWDFVTYVFGGILAVAALRTLREDPSRRKRGRSVRWVRRLLPVTSCLYGDAFVAREQGRRVATPLFIALVAVELTDIAFAIDSVPAALSVTHDRFVVYSSNAFAVLGLRSLYLVVAHSVLRLPYLHYGLAAVLGFAAFKIVSADFVHIPPWLSVAIIATCIALAVLSSLWARKRAAAHV